MNIVLFFLFLSVSLRAETSKLIPVFIEASTIYADGDIQSDTYTLKPEIRVVLSLLKKSGLDPEFLKKRTVGKKINYDLRPDDEFDQWIKNSSAKIKLNDNFPEISLHAYQLSVIEESDDWFNDDIYVYFFVTDGVIPTGKVTSIYKGLDEGQSFFFNEVDRAIYPLVGMPAKTPHHHLIVDYGLVESDGDDISEMQKLSSVIIDIALAVYSAYDPQRSGTVINLRKEIKALSEMLLSLNHDDRLATGSFGYKVEQLAQLLKDQSYIELSKSHKSDTTFDSWEYELFFRILR